jgi:hypothetical protein
MEDVVNPYQSNSDSDEDEEDSSDSGSSFSYFSIFFHSNGGIKFFKTTKIDYILHGLSNGV